MSNGSALDIKYLLVYMSLLINTILAVSANSSSGQGEEMCPLGFDVSPEGNCVCADPSGFSFGGQVQCNVESTSECAVTYSTVMWGHCVTLDASNVSEIVAGACFQTSIIFPSSTSWPGNGSGKYLVLPTDPTKLQEYFCSNSHRSGTLCAECSSDTAIDINSITMECISRTRCSNISWLWVTLELLLPLTFFIALISYVGPNLTSPNLYIVIVISQFLGIPVNVVNMKRGIAEGLSVSVTWLADFFTAVYSVWNLDIGRYLLPSLCISQPLGRMQLLALNYATAFFPLLLISLAIVYSKASMYVCHIDVGSIVVRHAPVAAKWTPFSSWCASPKFPTVKTVATFLLLAHNKLVRVSVYLLMPQPIYDVNGSVVRYALFFDASVNYFSSAHLPYALLALCVIATFNVLPTSILLFYQFPWFRRVLGYLRLNRQGLVAFVDVFQGHYKNRFSHTRDYRFFAGIFSIVHTLSVILFCLNVSSGLDVIIAIITTNVMIAALLLCQPFKLHSHNTFNAITFVYLSMALEVYLYMKTIFGSPSIKYSVLVTVSFLSALWPAVYLAVVAGKSLWRKFRVTLQPTSQSVTNNDHEVMKLLDGFEESLGEEQ